MTAEDRSARQRAEAECSKPARLADLRAHLETAAPYAAPDPMRQIRADLERDAQRREYVAGVESAMLAARWALPVSAAVEAERISRQGTNGLGLDPLAVDGVFLSGDHRPRHGRLYARDVPRWEGPTCLGCAGAGVARFTPAPPAKPCVHTCPACNGHGREPSE